MKLPSTPITIGLIMTFFILHKALIVMAKSRHFSTFSSSFGTVILSPGQATSMVWQTCSLLFTTTISGLLCASLLPGIVSSSSSIIIEKQLEVEAGSLFMYHPCTSISFFSFFVNDICDVNSNDK